MLSGIDDPQTGEVQTFEGLVHRFGYFRSFAEFAFNPVPAAVMDEKRSISAPLWVARKNAWGGLMICRICSTAKPSQKRRIAAGGIEIPSLGISQVRKV